MINQPIDVLNETKKPKKKPKEMAKLHQINQTLEKIEQHSAKRKPYKYFDFRTI